MQLDVAVLLQLCHAAHCSVTARGENNEQQSNANRLSSSFSVLLMSTGAISWPHRRKDATPRCCHRNHG
uniref:Putative secreted protein n=1 Tax=Anopheles darlingi TaxID=43151 RepID=A0A2M4DLN0_ANODA